MTIIVNQKIILKLGFKTQLKKNFLDNQSHLNKKIFVAIPFVFFKKKEMYGSRVLGWNCYHSLANPLGTWVGPVINHVFFLSFDLTGFSFEKKLWFIQ